MDICLMNLDAVSEYLEGTGTRRDEMTEQCCFCQETCKQEENVCPGCGVPVIWLHSRVWRREYGDPKRYQLRLEGKLKPKTPLQVEMCQTFNETLEFRTVTQQREAQSIERQKPDDFIREMMVWAEPRGWGAFVNACRKEDVYKRWLDKTMTRVEGIPGDELW